MAYSTKFYRYFLILSHCCDHQQQSHHEFHRILQVIIQMMSLNVCQPSQDNIINCYYNKINKLYLNQSQLYFQFYNNHTKYLSMVRVQQQLKQDKQICLIVIYIIYKQLDQLRLPVYKDSNIVMQTKLSLYIVIIILIANNCQSRIVYPDGLWPMNSFGQFSTQNQQILSYYDFNRDRFVDILSVVHSATHQLRIYLYSEQFGTFIKKGTLQLGVYQPVSAIAADFIQDGIVDIVLTSQLPDIPNQYQSIIYSINCNLANCTILNNANHQAIQSTTYPTVMHIHNKNVLLYTKDNKLRCQYYKQGKLEQSGFIQQFFAQPSDQLIQGVCTNYLDIYYIDYNGDCLLDLIIHCNNSNNNGLGDEQFYKSNSNGLFVLQKVSHFGDRGKLLRTAVADINFDGLVDIIQLVAANSGIMELQIHYNSATKSTTTQCTTLLNNYFPFQFISSDQQLNSGTQALKIQRVQLKPYAEWVSSAVSSQNFYLRPGDINNDGFIDLIIDGPNRAMLYINQQCKNETCGKYNSKFMQTWPLGLIRIFTQRDIDGMANYNNKICSMSFLDIQQEGRLDLISNLCSSVVLQPQTKGTILAIYNSLPIDAFFLKITILQNILNETVKIQTMDKKLNINGAHADFYVTALNGEKIPANGNQLSHPGRSLQLPYIHTGLGRTNNYVQKISVIISGKESVWQKSWTPIVPNSQLIIAPGPKWILQTYISPTAVMNVLALFVIVVLVIIGIWITKLTRKQKIQDKQNQDSFYAILR